MVLDISQVWDNMVIIYTICILSHLIVGFNANRLIVKIRSVFCELRCHQWLALDHFIGQVLLLSVVKVLGLNSLLFLRISTFDCMRWHSQMNDGFLARLDWTAATGSPLPRSRNTATGFHHVSLFIQISLVVGAINLDFVTSVTKRWHLTVFPLCYIRAHLWLMNLNLQVLKLLLRKAICHSIL